jgi:hypothetical protein
MCLVDLSIMYSIFCVISGVQETNEHYTLILNKFVASV